MNWMEKIQTATEGSIEWSVRWSMEQSAWLVKGRNTETGETYSEKVGLIPSHIFGPDGQDTNNINYALDRVIVRLGGQSRAPSPPPVE